MDKAKSVKMRWICDARYILMVDNLACLITFLCLYAYADAIVDITPQLITFNQRTKSNSFRKNKHSIV
jgi:hypothetical protein